MPLPPQEVAGEEEEETDLTVSSKSDNNSSEAESHREYLVVDTGGPYCLQLGSFLVRVMHEQTIYLRALLGQNGNSPQLIEATFSVARDDFRCSAQRRARMQFCLR